MVSKHMNNSPIFIACRPTGIIAILIFFIIALMVSGNASASNLVLNGDFETGDFTNWTSANYVVSNLDAYSGVYSAYSDLHIDAPGSAGNNEGYQCFYQSINLTDVDSVQFYYKHDLTVVGGGGINSFVYCDIGRDDSYEWIVGYDVESYTLVEVDTSTVSGVHDVEFGSYQAWNQAEYYISCRFDDIVGIASAASPVFDDVSWDQDPYCTGETANITTNILNFDDVTYSYYLDLYNTNDYLTTYEITSETESNYYTFPIDWLDTSLLAKLQRVTEPYGTNEIQLDYEVSHFETLNWDTSVAFNADSYDPGETLTVTWSGAPSGSTVWLRAMDDGEKIETDVAYSGSFQFTVPIGTEETYYLVDVVKSGISQVQASCDINIGDYWSTDHIYIDSYTVNKTSFEGQTVTLAEEESAKATVTTNIDIDYIDVYYYTEEMGTTITQDYDYVITDKMVNVTFPNDESGYYYVIIKVFNISTVSQNRQVFFFDVGTGSQGIDIYNSKIQMMDTNEVLTTASSADGPNLFVPLARTVMFDIYTDELINSTLITSDDLDEGGANYNFTQTNHLRRSYNFDTPGLYVIEMTVYNDETNSNDYIKWNVYVQGTDQSLLDGNVVMYWTKSEMDLDEHAFLFYNVTNMPEQPVLTVTTTAEGDYSITYSMQTNHTSSYTIPDYYKRVGVYTATITCEGVVYAIATLTIIDPDAEAAVDEVTEDETFADKFSVMLDSDSFIALLVIVSCVSVFGRTLGPVGAILGASIGTSMSYLMELIPVWIVFVMVLALSVVFASKLIEKFGGGQ